MDPFFVEGGGGYESLSTYERKSLRIKYLMEKREVTDVASMVGIIGNNANAVAEATERGTISLLSKLEKQLFIADSSINPLAFDGIDKQMADGAPNNVSNLAGDDLTPMKLQEILSGSYAEPNFGKPSVVLVEPRVHAQLIEQATAYGRHDMMGTGSGTMTFGRSDLRISVPYGTGSVPVVGCPFLYPEGAPNAAAIGTAPTFGVAINAPSAATNAASLFLSGDAGTYYYHAVAVGQGGKSAPVVSAAVTVAAGESVTVSINDDGLATPVSGSENTASILYYKIYRSTTGTHADAKWAFNVKKADTGADTSFRDDNLHRPGMSKAYALQMTPDVIEWVKLLDFIRRPLAETKTTKPFLLMLFGALNIKVPTKNWLIRNIKTEP